MLKRILIGLAVLILLLLGAVLILPSLVPTDTYRDRLEADLSHTFARDVTIDGDIKISTFPVLKVDTGAVALANPENFPEGRFVDVEAMSAKVRLWPLLKKRVEISGVTFKSPSINLEKQADGSANWVGKPSDDITEKGPFKRDGRFTEYDPALALLKIEDGTVTYRDLAAGHDFKAEKINLNLRAPSLSKPLKADGDFLFDGLDTSLDAALDSPADFLNGLQTGFAAKIITPEVEADVTGQFLASQDIVIEGNFQTRSEQPNALATRLPLPSDLAVPSLSALSAKGDISYAQDSIILNRLNLAIEGENISADFKGDVNLTHGATSSGIFTAKLDDMAIIRPYLENPVEALNAVTSVNAEGRIKWTGNNFEITDITSSVSGPKLTAKYSGNANYNEIFSLEGKIEGQASDVPDFIKTAGLDQPDAAALKSLSMNGQVGFLNGVATFSNLTAEASEGFLNGKYSGKVIYGETLELDGQFSGEISDLETLDAALPRDIPYSNVAKRISLTSQIKSTSAGYTLSDLTAELNEGLLNGRFSGALSLGNASNITGELNLSTESLRSIATSQDIALPESTQTGQIFEAFSLSGIVSGTPDKMQFNTGLIKLDALSGKGDFALEMSGPKPLLTGALDLDSMDLRPYMAAWSAQNPTGEILPWSQETISLSGLESVGANIDITAPSIILDRLELGQTDGIITLQNGILTADLKNTKLYGGNAVGVFTMQSTGGVPTIAVDATIKSVAAQKFFMASAGFEKLTGTSDLSLSFVGRGKSQADIMKSLSGDGVFKILKGQLLGIDAGTLLTGLDQALTTRQLPQGIGIGKITDFNDIEGVFALSNGRASLNGFELQSGSFFMDADGAIDIGQQTIDIGIRPKLSEGSNLAKFGIPLRFTGGFGQAKPALDTTLLGDIVKAKARASAGERVRETIGGSIGNVIGGVIGGQTPNPELSQDPNSAPSTPSNPAPTEAPSPEAEDLESSEDEPATETPEEQIGNALKDLFGRKKKNNEE